MVDDATRAAMQTDHVGVDLWQTSRLYEGRMYDGLRAIGYADVTLADSDVLAFVGPDGTRSARIAQGRRITKQATQEQVQRLVRRGYLTLAPDPSDRRAKLVHLTERGAAMMRDLEGIKRALHAEALAALGERDLAALRDMLARLRAGLAADAP